MFSTNVVKIIIIPESKKAQTKMTLDYMHKKHSNAF